MPNRVPPTKDTLREAFDLSSEILKALELGEALLSNVALKAVRLARLLTNEEDELLLQYEARGYPKSPAPLSAKEWQMAQRARRGYKQFDVTKKEWVDVVYTDSIEEIETEIEALKLRLQAAGNAPVSGSQSNNPFVPAPHMAYIQERENVVNNLRTLAERKSARRSVLYDFVLLTHYELKFSGIASDVFARVRERVDAAVGQYVPESIKKFTAAYENLVSENPEDWSNAVHSCRRILIDLADTLYPAREDKVEVGGKKQTIQLGQENYVNRLVSFVEDRSSSERFTEIVGSHLSYLGERLDAIVEAMNKGSHKTIVSRDEADRYVLYSYLLIGDILTLLM